MPPRYHVALEGTCGQAEKTCHSDPVLSIQDRASALPLPPRTWNNKGKFRSFLNRPAHFPPLGQETLWERYAAHEIGHLLGFEDATSSITEASDIMPGLGSTVRSVKGYHNRVLVEVYVPASQ